MRREQKQKVEAMQEDTNPSAVINHLVRRILYHHGQTLGLALFIHVPHVNDLVLQLLHCPDLTAALFPLHQDGWLTDESAPLWK